jgi:hypothetical protein
MGAVCAEPALYPRHFVCDILNCCDRRVYYADARFCTFDGRSNIGPSVTLMTHDTSSIVIYWTKHAQVLKLLLGLSQHQHPFDSFAACHIFAPTARPLQTAQNGSRSIPPGYRQAHCKPCSLCANGCSAPARQGLCICCLCSSCTAGESPLGHCTSCTLASLDPPGRLSAY